MLNEYLIKKIMDEKALLEWQDKIEIVNQDLLSHVDEHRMLVCCWYTCSNKEPHSEYDHMSGEIVKNIRFMKSYRKKLLNKKMMVDI